MIQILEKQQKAIFFDRDGVLNFDKGYIFRPEDFVWIEGAVEAIKFAKLHGFLTFVVTNQSGIARGFYSIDDMMALHCWMNEELKSVGTKIDRFYYCPYHEEGCVEEFVVAGHPDRKPNPGMILRAIYEFSLAREGSLLIGDKQTDLIAAERAGIEALLFEGGNLCRVLEDWYNMNRF